MANRNKLLCVLLLLLVVFTTFGCQDDSAGAETVAPSVYWNLTGETLPEADANGNYTLKFFCDGNTVEYTCADEALAKWICKQDILGLKLDGSAITDIVYMMDMPYRWPAWNAYVKGMGGDMVKVNSEQDFIGTEAMFKITEQTKVYNVSPLARVVGEETEIMRNDGVTVLTNDEDEAVLVFVSNRATLPDETASYCSYCEKDVIWNAWLSDTQMPAANGHYRLEKDVYSQGTAKVGSVNMCLDLNGHRVEQVVDGIRMYHITGGATVTLMDTVGTGVMRPSNTYMDVPSPHKNGMIFCVENGAAVLNIYDVLLDASGRSVQYGGAIDCPRGTVNFYSGTILAADPYGTGSGAIRCGGTVNMYGGKIIGGTHQDIGYVSKNIHGGAVLRSDGIFNMFGGEIVGGTSYTNGGILYCQGIMNLMGGTITDGKSEVAGSGVYVASTGTLTISGDMQITGNEGDNVYVGWSGKLVVEDDLEGAVGVSMENPGELSPCGSEKVLEHLSCDDPAYKLVLRNGMLYME